MCPDDSEERDFAKTTTHAAVIGVDEAGRGPWAGPVVAAAFWFDPNRCPTDLISRFNDSKKLTPKQRTALFATLKLCATAKNPPLLWATGTACEREIDRLNILQASFLAMRRATETLTRQIKTQQPACTILALVDGNTDPGLSLPTRTVVKGDSRALSIAGASICAKVVRDQHMASLATLYPGYAFDRNHGYGTTDHSTGLSKQGICPVHRRSFAPVRRLCDHSVKTHLSPPPCKKNLTATP